MQLHYMGSLFVLIAGDQPKRWSRNTLSSPPLTQCVYRAVSTTRLETVQDQATVWTWLPRAQACHRVSGEERVFFVLNVIQFALLALSQKLNSGSCLLKSHFYSLVTISALRYTCISKYNDPETGWTELNWTSQNKGEENNHLGTWNFHWKPNNVLQRHTTSCRADGGQGGKPRGAEALRPGEAPE